MKIKKQYVPIYVASILLFIMVVALVLLLTDKDEKVYIPKPPKDVKVDVAIIDKNFNSIRNIKNTAMQTKSHVIDSYYKKGFALSGVDVKLLNNNITVYNTLATSKPFLSVIDLNGKEKFLTGIPIDKYDEIEIIDVGYINEYNVVAFGKKKKSEDLIVAQIDKNGKYIKTDIIEKDIDYLVYEVYFDKENIYAVTHWEDISFKTINKGKIISTYNLDKDKNDKFISSNPVYCSSYYKDGIGYLLLKSDNYSIDSLDEAAYLYKIDIKTNTSTVVKYKELADLENDLITFKGNYFYRMGASYLKAFDLNGKFIKEVNYENLELENDVDYRGYVSEEYKDKENYVYINRMLKNNDQSIFVFNTLYSTIFDLYTDNNLTKRYVVNRIKNSYYGLYKDSIILEDKIIEVYTYGYDRPSILVNIIS